MSYFKHIDQEHIEDYARKHSSEEFQYLKDLERVTHLKTSSPRMLSGWEQGRLLSTLSSMLKPDRILEIGTFTGYSALCLAEGLSENGRIDTIDINVEWNQIAKEYAKMSNYEGKINFILQNAHEFLEATENTYDLCFIDADKESYFEYYEGCLKLLQSGGYILVDNVLWSGKVLSDQTDSVTKVIKEFNKMLASDSRVECFLLPVRDGLSIVRKK